MDIHAANTPDAASDLGAIIRALEHLPAPAHVVEVDEGRSFPFIAANVAMEELMRTPRDRIVGVPLTRIADASEVGREGIEAHLKVAETARPLSYTILVPRPGGGAYVHCALTPLCDWTGRVTHILGVDCEVSAEVRSQLQSDAEERRRQAQVELEVRARADALVADASTRLLSAPAEQVGDAVCRALAQFCEQIGADHAALWQADETERRFVRSHTWSHPEVGDRIERGPTWAVADDMPWADEHGETSDDPLFVPDVAALPPEAAAERAMLESLGVRSMVSVTITHDDRLLGVVSVVWVLSKSGPTTAATFPALRILGNSLLAALDRARFEYALRLRRDAEALVAEVTRELVVAAPAEVDDAIARGLERTARFVGAQAASLVNLPPGGARSRRSHVWDVNPERMAHWAPTGPPATDQWIQSRLEQVDDLVVVRVADDPDDIVPALRERLVSYGVQAIGYLPLRSGGRLVGWVTMVWFEGDPGPDAAVALPALRVLGEVYLLAIDRARAAENLRKSARTLEWAQATAHIGSWSYEPATGEIAWSDELFRILGFEPGSVPATPEVFHRVVPPPEGGGITALEELRDMKAGFRGMRKAVRPDGEERIVVSDLEIERDADGSVLHMLGTMQDVTEAVRAEQAVRDSEARFRALVLESGELIQLVDADGTILYASPAVERDLGWDVTGVRVTDQRLIDVIHPDDREVLLLKFVESLDRPHAPVQLAFRVLDRQGRWRSREAMLTNMLDDPRVSAVVLNARDLTERRELEEQLRESQKMEAVGQLAGGIAHDFNNLLTAITGYTALLMDDVPEGAMRADLEQIQRAADRAAALVEKLLQFSRRQPTNPTLLDVNEVIESLGNLLQRVIGEHITLETALSPTAGQVRADRSHIEQVVMNFVVNARDAMPNGGRLTIASTDVALDPAEAERITLPAGRYLRLDVADTGTGMDEAVTARVFEPFFTTKGVGKGTGLGLSTVYGIVTAAGGHVSVASRSGEGTTFTVHLPVVPAGDGSAVAPVHSAAQPNPASWRP